MQMGEKDQIKLIYIFSKKKKKKQTEKMQKESRLDSSHLLAFLRIYYRHEKKND